MELTLSTFFFFPCRLFNKIQPIITIPKPKAKVEETPKPAEETPAADADMADATEVPVEGEKEKEAGNDMSVEELD